MEVEVKVRLPDSTSHQKLSTLLSPFHTKTLLQENVFFDGSDSQLSSNLAVLRLRFITTTATAPNHCVLSLKAKPVISQGISRAQELEEPMDPTLGRACIAEPWRLLSVTDSAIVKRVKQEFGVFGLFCLGGFRNLNTWLEAKKMKENFKIWKPSETIREAERGVGLGFLFLFWMGRAGLNLG